MSKSPQAVYEQDLSLGVMLPDAAQAVAVTELQRIYDALMIYWQGHGGKKLLRLLKRKRQPVQGVYLWGSVGVGKTYLMDIFFHCLDSKRKLRIHYHHFMRQVQKELKTLQGTKNPLNVIAKRLQAKVDIICFDEFFVKDIANAMILGNLFAALFERGICLVATSNVIPDELYRNGLQRDLFLPAIDLLKQYTKVFHVNSEQDYRLRELTKAGVYFTPLCVDTYQKMDAMFHSLAHEFNICYDPLRVAGRDIAVIARASSVIWFDFAVLCHAPRSQSDYLDIANDYQSIMLSNIPQIQPGQDSAITYLIFLVDICYDTRVHLIISAANDIDGIYPKGRLAFEFERTKSRLIEMQTEEYLAMAHKPHENEV